MKGKLTGDCIGTAAFRSDVALKDRIGVAVIVDPDCVGGGSLLSRVRDVPDEGEADGRLHRYGVFRKQKIAGCAKGIDAAGPGLSAVEPQLAVFEVGEPGLQQCQGAMPTCRVGIPPQSGGWVRGVRRR